MDCHTLMFSLNHNTALVSRLAAGGEVCMALCVMVYGLIFFLMDGVAVFIIYYYAAFVRNAVFLR